MIQSSIFDYLDCDIHAFKERPPTKINSFKVNSAFSKKYLLPIYETVIKMNSEQEIISYFENRFYFEKRDYVPYAEEWKFLIGEKGCRAMLMTGDLSFSDFIYILNHHGREFGGRVFLDDLIFPPGMSADMFRNSLTDTDKEKILSDLERLLRLHNNRQSYQEYRNHILEDYRINTQ